MRHTARSISSILLLLAALFPAFGQSPDEYSMLLPSGWEQTSFTDGAKVERIEYIYGDRSSALLKIKRVRLEPGETLEAYVEKDTSITLRFLPGYLQGRNERFAGGALAGNLVQFDFTRGGKPMLGRYYYLSGADNASVWVLQFTGDRTELAKIRNLTDQMARSFRER